MYYTKGYKLRLKRGLEGGGGVEMKILFKFLHSFISFKDDPKINLF
jgi:hypothetical protein